MCSEHQLKFTHTEIERTTMATQARKETRTVPLIFDHYEPDGSNYMDWRFNIRANLAAEELDATIDLHPEEEIPSPYLWQAMLIMRGHMDPSLRMQYLPEENLARLWAALEARFRYEEMILLPHAQAD